MTNSTSPKPGRPTLLSRQTFDQLVHAAESGETRADMAAHIGVSLRTLQQWIGKGRKARAQGTVPDGHTMGRNAVDWDGLSLEHRTLLLVEALDAAGRRLRAAAEAEAAARRVQKTIGAPPSLTADVLEAVAAACGNEDLSGAAAAAGVEVRTVYRWIARGREVHAAGGFTTEYERLCHHLYVNASDTFTDSSWPNQSRRTALTPARLELLVRAVEGGASQMAAAAQAGISHRTLIRWMELGAQIEAERERPVGAHERRCVILRRQITAAERAVAARKDAAPAVVEEGVGGPDEPEAARPEGEPVRALPPRTASGVPERPRSAAWLPLLGRVLTNRFAFRALRA
ncbi:hypothetical protein [Streptomyces sp. NPDC097619]|uniref:hypothetical protein n=1 Tax=Streptomyces sp. NPDC097619 TaxID=3157228 RepID=UPI0033170865